MKINKNMTTEQVKRKFHERYPMLKIEFYNKEHATFAISSNRNKITEEIPLSDLNPDIESGKLSLSENLRVSEFERLLENRFGLHIQVFRKSGNQWMQTSITDSWTLGKQEAKGESLEKFIESQQD